MAALLSQQSANSPTTTLFLTLLGAANYAVFRTELSDYLNSNFGEVGQHVILGTNASLVLPGRKPSYFDPRTNPRTGTAIPLSRKYAVKPLTEDQTLDTTFDRDTLELTDFAAKCLADDIAAWTRATMTYTDRLLSLRTLDDAFYNFLLNHIDRGTLEVLKAHSDHAPFKLLPATCIDRGHQYLKIIDKQYSIGNSTVSITEMTKFLTLTQGPVDEESTASFVNKVMEHYARISPFFSQCATVDEVKELLVTMVLIKGLNKHHHPSLRALEIFTQTHKNMNAFRNFAALRQEVLAAQDSDLSNLSDSVSEHSSAFKAALVDTSPHSLVAHLAAGPPHAQHQLTKPHTHPPTTRSPDYGLLPNKNGKPSCPYCLTNLKRHYTHSEADCFNKKNGTRGPPSTAPARTNKQKSVSTVDTQLLARLAAVEAATAAAGLPNTNSLVPIALESD